MGMWATFISPFKNTALLQLGLLQSRCPNTLVSLNNYTFKLEISCPVNENFLPVPQALPCFPEKISSLQS